jgi:hypothetical protein
MKTHYAQVIQTTYTMNNKGDAEQTVYLDHPRSGKDWKLFETADPHETTENYWRFRFPLPAKTVTKFVVRQRRTLHQSFSLADVGDQQLALWLEQKYLDAKTEKVLRKVVDLRQQAAAVEGQIQQLQQERDTIHADQKRIRENLKGLGDRSAEKELRERFVRTLNGQEDRLEQIEKELRELNKGLDRSREQINGVLGQLEYEAAV